LQNFYFNSNINYFPVAQQTCSGLDRLVVKVSGSYTLRHTTLGRTPPEEGSSRRRNLYLTRHNTHKRHTSMPGRDSNSQSKQASCRRTTPYTARPPGSTIQVLSET